MSKDVRLFLSDLDGTILTTEKKIMPGTMTALRNFVDCGGHFAICTGRDINSALKVYYDLELNLKGSYVVAYNGGQIYDVDNNKTIFREGIEKSLALDIFKLAKEYGIHVHTYNDDFILSVAYNECMDFYRRVIKTPLIVADDISDFINVPPCKIICIELHDHEKQERFKEIVEERFGDALDLMYSNDYYLELIPKGSGKGSALIRLRELLGIDRKCTMAAGDGENDMSMIEAAGLGVAMINAPENVKAVADVVTSQDNDHDGLKPIIEDFTK